MKLIAVAELKNIKSDKNLFLLDVREHDEVASTPMAGMPFVHIPMNDVPQQLSQIDEDKMIVVFCLAGGRSAKVCEYLISQGYQNVSNLTGGMLAWVK
ncbi:MAG: rhodanese-related sulfurtransferase [Alphaproteobacteria bacterium]|jgi:rhodanese-related sulfurtransferase